MEGNIFREFNSSANGFTVNEDQQLSAPTSLDNNMSPFDQLVATMSLDGVLHPQVSTETSISKQVVNNSDGYKKWWQLFILIPIAVFCSLSLMIIIAVVSGFLFSGKSVFDIENWTRLFTG